jgi:hypothetical protein
MPSNQEAVLYDCNCQCGGELVCCGPNRCLPHQTCANPLPYDLRINVTGTYTGAFGGGTCTCLLLDSTITFYENSFDNPDVSLPYLWSGTFTTCGKTYRYSLGCVDGTLGWRLAFYNNNLALSATPTDCLASSTFHPDGVLMAKASCNPLTLAGVMNTSGIGCCEAAHLVGLATLDVTIWEE